MVVAFVVLQIHSGILLNLLGFQVPVSLSANLPGATGASGEEIRLKTDKEEPIEVNGQGENELNGTNDS